MTTKSAKVEQYERAAGLALQAQLANKKPVLLGSVVELLTLADRLHRYAETDCNFGLTEKQRRAVSRLEARVTYFAEALGAKVTFNGDPRGYAVKLHFPSGVYNTWGGKSEGWGI